MDYGLIGGRLGHSYSPMLHRAFADYDYRLAPMAPEEMSSLLERRDFRGLNVTIPYKKDVLPFCDRLSPEVLEVGSANTLVMREGRLLAFNTDLEGFLYMMRRAGISLKGRKAVILGSGGTSLTARAACLREGAREIVTVSRGGPVTYEELYARHRDAEVLINATPVGMYPDNLVSPVELGAFPGLKGVADVIYNPARTALLLDAEAAGIPCADGLWMLAAQAWAAARLFTDEDIPSEKIAEAYAAVRRATLNLVLVGMPGCGKTTLGRAAAGALGRRLVDLDEAVEAEHGPIPEIFRQRGEAAFRALESDAVRRFGKESGLVIATGGGAVLREENVRALRQNAVICWVRRPLERLTIDGRPLSASRGALERMERDRFPLYRACADIILDNETSPAEAAGRLTEAFNETAGAERTQPEHAGHP